MTYKPYINPDGKFKHDPESVPEPWFDYLRNKNIPKDKWDEELGKAYYRALNWMGENHQIMDSEDVRYACGLFSLMGLTMMKHEAMNHFMILVNHYKAQAAERPATAGAAPHGQTGST